MTTRAGEPVAGRVEAIELVNINKASGRFTYNVELVLDRGPAAGRARVRLPARLYWARLATDQRLALAPHGPQPTLRPDTYGGFRVGQTVQVLVQWTSMAPEPLGLLAAEPT